MKTKSLLIALTLSIAVFTSCTDKKKTEKKPQVEVGIEESNTNTIEKQEKAEKRRLDSIRQVKEHGHAH